MPSTDLANFTLNNCDSLYRSKSLEFTHKGDNADVNKNCCMLTIDFLESQVGQQVKYGTIIQQHPLLKMIPVENRIVSLHLRLGIATHALMMLYREVSINQ
jgi:hypothetical protein